MKILHTSDWHLGHNFYGYDRSDEHKSFFRQLVKAASDERPDVMIVSGDVFHQSNPSAAAQKLYTESMLELHRQCPDMQVIVIAGNHDSGSRLEIDRSLWGHFGIDVVGTLQRKGAVPDLEKHIIEIKDSSSDLKGYVVAVPYISPVSFPDLSGNSDRAARRRELFMRLYDMVEQRNEKGLPVVLAAHIGVSGSDLTGHSDMSFSAGGGDSVSLDTFGHGYDYLALGHIHRRQTIPGSDGRARYSGTPLPVSFDEAGGHSLSVVEIAGHLSAPEISEVMLEVPVPVITLPQTPVDFNSALELAAGYPSGKPAYIRLNVKSADYLPASGGEQAAEIFRDKEARYCHIRLTREEVSVPDGSLLFTEDIMERSPAEVASIYYRRRFSGEIDRELLSGLNEVIDEVKSDIRV